MERSLIKTQDDYDVVECEMRAWLMNHIWDTYHPPKRNTKAPNEVMVKLQMFINDDSKYLEII